MASTPQGKRALRIAVIGGGVIGLACALELRGRGAEVTVYEKGAELGAGASSRSAGMLAAAYEWGVEEDQPALAALARHAGEIWPEFAAKVERLGGGPVELSREGALVVALTLADTERLEVLTAACQARALPVERVSAAELTRLEPALTGQVRSALLLPQDRQLDPLLLLQRMAAALARVGVGLKFGRPVERVIVGRQIAMPDGERVDALVLATGAGAMPKLHGIRGEELATGVAEVAPVKGQMVALAPVSGAPRHVVHGGGVYVAPKKRWVLVGATVERGVGDVAVDRAVVEALKSRASALMGVLGGAPEVSAWAGVRPGTADDAPMVGATRIEGVFAALGAYRNGVLFAPAVAEWLADAVLDGARRRAFDPLRFLG